ncbi:hypothetical protein BD310DRAFT_977335 [Dichomitus squalens]|uniref:Uncharacterized protein n=1 Tax=Dichomitus squalens TaxID=114155 RepID=A0A4Q9PVA4_9APHY|nr:hypothetical protein BD310DRAFT_977335 [Dichomitus squalens]
MRPRCPPARIVPPSWHGLGSLVDELKDILTHDTHARSPAGLDPGPTLKMRPRSFYDNAAGADGRQDTAPYKHKDETPAGGFHEYQPLSRHVGRSAIRTTTERASPMRTYKLENTVEMLEPALTRTQSKRPRTMPSTT